MRMLFTAILLFSIIQFSSCKSKAETEEEKIQKELKVQADEKHKIDSTLLIGRWQEKGYTGVTKIIDPNKISDASKAGERVNSENYSWVRNRIYITGKTGDEVYIRPYIVFVTKDSLIITPANDEKAYGRLFTRFTTNTTNAEPKMVVDDQPTLPTTTNEGEEYKVNSYEEYTVNTKSYLYDKADPSTKRKGYLISGDLVGVVEKRGDFAYVYYTNPQTHKAYYSWVLLSTLNEGRPLE